MLALIVALSGTALAGPIAQLGRVVSGDKLIKKHSLSGNRLRNHTLTGTQINLRALGKVPLAARADSASSALSASTALSARSADNANTLGGVGPSAYQSASRWALVNGDSIVAQSGGISVAQHSTSGDEILDFHSSVAGRAILATVWFKFSTTGSATVQVSRCGAPASDAFDCGAGLNDDNHVLVETFQGPTSIHDEPYYVVVL
jgi:hypothetical protein